MADAPTKVGYGRELQGGVAGRRGHRPGDLGSAGATTHAFDQNQRFNRLEFSPGSSSLTVTAPSNANLAPPGHYMMFILNHDGVPSRAKVVQIE